MPKSKTKPVTALYLRISLDDDNHDISDSVANQRDLLMAYVANHPVLSAGEVLTFADDGWSGTNFERPQVKALLDLVRRGGVQNILVKDLSRWGRNYPVVSEYLDQIFPFLGVRFISVNDDYDSENHKGQTAPMTVAFSSIVHDMYSKELSVKVKQAHVAKAKNGEYVCGTVPYGFTRSDTEKNRLVVDHEAAAVIQRIYDMACQGLNNVSIAAALNADGVDSPLEHRRRHGRSVLAMRPKAGRSFWGGSVISRMLCDERYTGMMVFSKTKRISKQASADGRKVVIIPEADWIRVPNAHEAIISTEQFEKVQALKAGNTRYRRKNTVGIDRKNKAVKNGDGSDSHSHSSPARLPLAGKVICGYCNRIMRLVSSRPFFHCTSVKQNIGLGCYEGKVYKHDLEDILLTAVKAEAQKALDLRNRTHNEQQEPQRNSKERESVLSELKKLTTNITLLEQRNVTLYEDFADGKIERDAYVTAKSANSADMEAAQARVAALTERLVSMDRVASAVPSNTDASVLQRIIIATDVTSEVASLLESITVYDGEHIEIRFAFGDTSA